MSPELFANDPYNHKCALPTPYTLHLHTSHPLHPTPTHLAQYLHTSPATLHLRKPELFANDPYNHKCALPTPYTLHPHT